ncbi:MAG: hypothetical protein A2583_14455 [Bdellovibrionales bacterium RIFOXYD1_FULL_53_11]|nr:MAG: hypothetical protein A2583_14455 [Bdellovibrionales bacterium RIFOXYD1_FULL_53_11]
MALNLKGLKTWIKKNPDTFWTSIACAVLAFIYTQGLPLWDADYSQWLAQADQSLFTLIKRTLLPVTTEPATWGYSDRPLQALICKILFFLFEYWGGGYFFVKSLAYGAFCGAVYHWMRALDLSRMASWMATALLALGTGPMAALFWHSDYAVYSQLVAILTLMYAHSFMQTENIPSSVWKKGPGKLPPKFKKFIIVLVLAVYFGTKIKADMRLVPLVLLAYVFIFERRLARAYILPLVLALAASLPWSMAMLKKLPPFFPGASGYQGLTHVPFAVARAASGLFVALARTPGLIVIAACVIMLALLYRSRKAAKTAKNDKEEKNTHAHPGGKSFDPLFFGTWAVMAALAWSTLPKIDAAGDTRYGIIFATPLVMLAAWIFNIALKKSSFKGWGYRLLVLAVALQSAVFLRADIRYRIDNGRLVSGLDEIVNTVETRYPGAKFALGPGLGDKAIKPSKVQSLAEKKSFNSLGEADSYSPGTLYIAATSPVIDHRFTIDLKSPGCTKSAFDAIFCKKTGAPVLLKYIGNPPELSNASATEARGDLQGARNIVEGLYRRDPDNHGVAFRLGLLAYKMTDYPLMERIYDAMGVYYPDNSSVLYNWGIAKHGVGKFKESAGHFGKAYKIHPGDYAIGFYLAEAWFRDGKKRKALGLMKELLKKYPGDSGLMNAFNKWSNS